MRKCAAHKTIVIFSVTTLLVLGSSLGASAWIFVGDQGDTGWQTYAYTAGPNGFTGKAGFVVSNAVDSSAYSELLLDNLSQGGGRQPWIRRGKPFGIRVDRHELCHRQFLGDRDQLQYLQPHPG